MWYEEGESEFDLVSRATGTVEIEPAEAALQEDEAELAYRKKLQEDEDVDIIGGIDDSRPLTTTLESGPPDVDFEWADEEGELDHKDWRMKLLMVEGEDGY